MFFHLWASDSQVLRSLFQSSPRSSPTKKGTYKPMLEALEARWVPAVITTWKGTTSTAWGLAANWSNGVPGPNDTANFDGNLFNNAASLTGATSIASLAIQGTYSATITISGTGTLSISNGGSMANGVIKQAAATNVITLSGGTFTWSGGVINPNGLPDVAQSTFVVSGGTFSILSGTGDNHEFLVGDNINNSATVLFHAAGGMQLGNGAGITNYSTGDFNIQVSTPISVSPVQGSTAIVDNRRTFEKTQDTGEATIAMPVVNQGSAPQLNVHAGMLTFTGT
jgi:hypothetical protein